MVLWQLDFQDKRGEKFILISEIRKKIKSKIGKDIIIYVDAGRNKEEKYYGKIYNAYNYVWTFKTDTYLRSFSYSDILSHFVVINSPDWWIF